VVVVGGVADGLGQGCSHFRWETWGTEWRRLDQVTDRCGVMGALVHVHACAGGGLGWGVIVLHRHRAVMNP
jgi:hypothetical protein